MEDSKQTFFGPKSFYNSMYMFSTLTRENPLVGIYTATDFPTVGARMLKSQMNLMVALREHCQYHH